MSVKRVLAGLASIAALSALPSTAAAAAERENKPQRCAILVGKSVNGEPSPVLDQHCSTSMSDARAHLRTPDGRSARAEEPLQSWYDLYDWNTAGDYTTVYGRYGTCDSSGYTLQPGYKWRDRISSVYGYGYCTRGRYHNIALDNAAEGPGSIKRLGPHDNNVGLIDLWYG